MTKEETESRQAELRATIREIEVFIASPLWVQYSGLVDAQMKGRFDQLVLTPLNGLDETFAQEYAKGEIHGLRLATFMLPQLIEDMQSELESLEPEE